jgi:biopolymer transport protein ExbD
MRAKSRKQKLLAEINITPFTDVVLVLLIIFMVTTPLIIQASIKVNLPNASSAKPIKNSSQAYVTLSNENLLYLNGQLVSKKELRRQIESMVKDNSGLNVILFSDKLVYFKEIVSVLDILNELGVKNLNIAAKPEQSE